MRALVTGASGFVGRWLVEHLQHEGDDVGALDPDLDITDRGALVGAVARHEPEVIYHLAAAAHVGGSWVDPGKTYAVNSLGTLHLLDAARRLPRPPRVLLVSSGEVYGAAARDGILTEDVQPSPITPYGASKLAAELLGMQAAEMGLDVVRTRAFNHVGPGQSPTFLVPGFASRIVAAMREGRPSIKVGNLSAVRDFSDVRDVVRAYRLLATTGAPGAVVNVCSGTGRSAADVAGLLLGIAGAELELVPDPELTRPVDLPAMVGDPTRLRAMGWSAQIDFEQTLRDVLVDVGL
ncbi:MAG TPA: GDP-mannose 4,6-dehydratase [Acidimicrobiales bacterium]|nr:GDP-mannose 4,6-dehydratase [Acidimicrobiales bacterium]